MKVLILGGAGMLGHKMIQAFVEKGHDVSCTIRGSLSEPPESRVSLFREVPALERVDVADLPCLRDLIRAECPDLIVNCVGVIKQRSAAKEAVISILTNSLLPHQLSEWAEELDCRLIHFSTDCIFDGKKGNYTLADPSNAEDLYGRTKFLGEASGPRTLTLRTSIIGRELSHFQSLIEWFLSQKGKTIRGYRRAYYSGMTTQTMADLVVWLVEERPGVNGVHQAVSETINKFDLLLAAKKAFDLDVEIEPFDDFFCDRSMDGSEFTELTGWVAPSWERQLKRMAEDPTPYEQWRQ